ncbi:MAG: ABC1 kinase family protein [Segniliparus sp.]|uniref:ABC1 kinase family protein n=1 Tax=Segniliparus sp. TaxID=2804064 RepID=UPI003F3E0B2C
MGEDIPVKGWRRNAKLASFSVGVAGQAAKGLGKRLGGKSKDEVSVELALKTAEDLFKVLGELKGVAMKMGQLLSIYETALPDEIAEPFREHLAKLQDQAPPLPMKQIHRVLDQQLGTRWRERFQSFGDAPVAAASIGQVHRAVWSDGRAVAVKVQYPGAEQAVRSDLRTIRGLSKLIKPLLPRADVDALIQEAVDRTEDELNYRQEADNQRLFAKAYQGDEKFFVPKVLASSPKILITEWIDGTPLKEVIAGGDQEQRDMAAARLLEFSLASPTIAKALHIDPHPGNFILMADGRLGVLDFGAVAQYPEGLPPAIGRCLRLALAGQQEEAEEELHAAGFLGEGESIPEHIVEKYMPRLAEAFDADQYHLSRERIQEAVEDATGVLFGAKGIQTMDFGRKLSLPPQYLMIGRAMSGVLTIAGQLDADVPARALAQRWLPGFAEESSPDALASA